MDTSPTNNLWNPLNQRGPKCHLFVISVRLYLLVNYKALDVQYRIEYIHISNEMEMLKRLIVHALVCTYLQNIKCKNSYRGVCNEERYHTSHHKMNV
jgi:hypothetical protein